MHIKQIRRLLLIPIALALASVSPTSLADCQSAKAATPTDIAGGQAAELFKAMIAACKSQDPSKFFDLQTKDAYKIISSISPAEKGKLFAQYCAFTNEAVNGLGGNLATAIHTVGPYKNKAKCGTPWSYWFIHSKAGELVFRMEVAVESGRLKIDTH